MSMADLKNASVMLKYNDICSLRQRRRRIALNDNFCLAERATLMSAALSTSSDFSLIDAATIAHI